MTEAPLPGVASPLRDRTLYCLQQCLGQYEDGLQVALNPDLQPHVAQLKTLRHKVGKGLLQVAVFGYVSRGKSALLNALLGEPLLPIGALNGVTQWPRSVRWQPFPEEFAWAEWHIELVDTPGLGEIEGATRAQMAMEIAQTADVLLFVIAGKPNASELASLAQLQITEKPLLLVSNKSDLYPQLTPLQIWDALRPVSLQHWIRPADILCAAANPAPQQVRNEWPDGRITEEWRIPPPQVEELRQRLIHFLQQEGVQSLLKNTLQQAEVAQRAMAQSILKQQEAAAQDLQLRFALLKAGAVALIPLAWIDVPLSLLLDLLLVRSLVRLYNLPTARQNVEALWRTLFFSGFGLLLCELGSGLLLGLGHAVAGDLTNLSGALLWASTAMVQGLAALYGTQRVGAATQHYLREGCTWMPWGASELLAQLGQIAPAEASPNTPNPVASPADSCDGDHL